MAAMQIEATFWKHRLSLAAAQAPRAHPLPLAALLHSPFPHSHAQTELSLQLAGLWVLLSLFARDE